jgi:thioredoxin-related protein
MFKKIELFANIAIIVVALILGVVLVKRYLFTNTQSATPTASRIQPGTKVQMADVDWSKSPQTLVLVISDTCHFCTESAGFYQRLAQEKTKHEGTRMIAVLPQDVSRGQAYLSKLGVAVDEVRQSPLSAIGVAGTPTLLLIDGKGVLKQSWVGKLPTAQETEVLSQFQVN